MLVVGVDPGIEGAIVVVRKRVEEVIVSITDMPVKGKRGKVELDEDGVRLALNMARDDGARVLVIEAQQAAPGQGLGSTFKLAQQYGFVRGVAMTLGMDVVEVAPTVWKSALRLKGGDKSLSRQAASKVWPGWSKAFERVKDHGRAEAALIALWGIRSGAVASPEVVS